MFSRPRPIITPIFEPKLHDVMTLPSSRFDIVSLPLSNTYRHFDVIPQHGSILSANFSQFNTFLPPFSSIPVSRTASADVLSLPYSFVLYSNRFCERTPMAPPVFNTLGVSALSVAASMLNLIGTPIAQCIRLFVSLHALYFTVVVTELPHYT